MPTDKTESKGDMGANDGLNLQFDTSRIKKSATATDDKGKDLTSVDWYRHIDTNITINGTPIKEQAAKYNNFETAGDIKAFFREECLTGLKGDIERQNEAIDYLRKTFNQAGFMHPVDMTLNDKMASSGLTIDRFSRHFDLNITPTPTGISITETISYDKVQVVFAENPLRPLCEYDPTDPNAITGILAAENKGDAILKASGTLELDFSNDASNPAFHSTDTLVVFGHSALKDYVSTGSLTEYFLSGHLNAYQEREAQLKFVSARNEIRQGVDVCVNYMYKNMGILFNDKTKNQDKIIELGRTINTLVVHGQEISAIHPENPRLVELLEALKDTLQDLKDEKLVPASTVDNFLILLGQPQVPLATEHSSDEEMVVEFHTKETSLSEEEPAVQWHEQKKPSPDIEPPTSASYQGVTKNEDYYMVMSYKDFIKETRHEDKEQKVDEMDGLYSVHAMPEEPEKEKEVLYVEMQYNLNKLQVKESLSALTPEDNISKELFQLAQDVIRAEGEKSSYEALKTVVNAIKDNIEDYNKGGGSLAFFSSREPSSKDPLTVNFQNASIELTSPAALRSLKTALKPVEDVIEAYKIPTLTIHL